jgi:glycosyltransferase involved in cell wall biosynthesis
MLERSQQSISIIVPCRNERASIGPLLSSIVTQDFAGRPWEAIVADGMSEDGTREVLKDFSRRYANIRVVDNPSKTTPAALNLAIRESKGKIIVRMDVHTIYAPDYVRQCVGTLLRTGADNVGGPALTAAKGYLQTAIAAAYHSPFACGGAKFHDPDYQGPVDTVPYGCWWKQTLLDHGGFDENLIRNQDDELNLRLVKRGGQIWQSPAIKSWYSPRANLKNLWRQYFQYGFWKVFVMRKHRLPASWRHLVPAAFALTITAVVAGSSLTAALVSPRASLKGWLLLAGIFGIYLAGCLLAAARTSKRFGWKLFPILPLIFATYHFSYGFGFLAGLLKGRPAGKSTDFNPLFTELTR